MVYESPVRVGAALEDMRELLGDREAFLCREATKRHEEYVRGRLSELRALAVRAGELKGEICSWSREPRSPRARGGARGPVRPAGGGGTHRGASVKETARALGLPARDVYRRC